MGIFGHMTNNSPLKPSEGGSGSTPPGDPTHTLKDAKDFLDNLDSEMGAFDSRMGSALEKRTSTSDALDQRRSEEEHFTLDGSLTRDTSFFDNKTRE